MKYENLVLHWTSIMEVKQQVGPPAVAVSINFPDPPVGPSIGRAGLGFTFILSALQGIRR